MLNKNIFEMLKYRHLQKNKNAFTLQNFSKKNLGGFTLIEVLTAIFLIVVGVIAALSLILQTISYTNFSSSKLIASYLAQEGIEIVRNIRDGNWLESANPLDWDEGLTGCSAGCEIDFNNFGNPDVEDPVLQSYQGRFLKIDGDFYNYNSGTDTKFTRKITIVSDTDGAAPRLKVSVEVEWQQLGKKQIVKAQEYLYNWR